MPAPPEAVTGVNDVAAVPVVRVVAATTWVVVRAGAVTVRLTVAGVEVPETLVTV